MQINIAVLTNEVSPEDKDSMAILNIKTTSSYRELQAEE